LVGFVAHFVQRCKKHETLVRAAARLKNNDAIAFVIVGGVGPDPSYYNEVRELARRLSVAERIKFVGYQSDVASYLNAMDVVVSCTEGEACGLNLLEAMACGKPVIATNSGGIPEFVQDGRTGMLYPLDDDEALARCIERMACSPEMARSMGALARKRARAMFALQPHADAIASVYERVLGGARASAMAQALRVLLRLPAMLAKA
ncbi:MAG: glycosyltransferase family 4 protein, partial [Candidatus Brocadiae bacterium]|nr:glycosyltransferase family 4 protein [Candidatus Brocadiia bacterium]